jgi:hypothetical protein
MKSKQSVNVDPVKKLAGKVAAFKGIYLDHTHTH